MKLTENNKIEIENKLIEHYCNKGNYFDYKLDFDIYYENCVNSWMVCLTVKNELFREVEIYAKLSWSTKKVLKKSIEIVNR